MSWRDAWAVDLESATVTHRDGWRFKFAQDESEAGAFSGECIATPDPMTRAHMDSAARIAREAGDIFIEARRERH